MSVMIGASGAAALGMRCIMDNGGLRSARVISFIRSKILIHRVKICPRDGSNEHRVYP
jgi:hypothetical protein